jgi:hypothetical protein
MALVIFCVALTEAIRFLSSFSDAMDHPWAVPQHLSPWGRGRRRRRRVRRD